MRRLVIAAIVLLVGCHRRTHGDAEPTGTLTVTGSSTMAPLVTAIAKRFEGLHPGVRIDVRAGGSSRAVADLREGTADIGMVSRPLRTDEDDLVAISVARDAVAIIVNRDNPVRTLDDQQIVGIYTGRYGRWSDVGGNDQPISVVSKDEGKSSLELFCRVFGLRPEEIQAELKLGDNDEAIRRVAESPEAIAFVSVPAAERAERAAVPIKILPLHDVDPSTEEVQTGRYPAARDLYLVTRGAPSPLARAFLEFARSKDVRDLVEAQPFIPLVE